MGVRRRLPHPPLHNHQLNPHTTTHYTRYTRRIPFQRQPQLYNNNAWNAFPPCVDISERSDSSLTLSVLLLYQWVRRAPLLLPSVIDCGDLYRLLYPSERMSVRYRKLTDRQCLLGALVNNYFPYKQPYNLLYIIN